MTAADEARLFHKALADLGAGPGTTFPRGVFEDLVIVTWQVESRQSIQTKIRVGQAYRLWSVEEAHGKGGRGSVTLAAPALT